MGTGDFDVSSYANMLKPDTESMRRLAKIILEQEQNINAVVDPPSEDEVKSALDELTRMRDGVEDDEIETEDD